MGADIPWIFRQGRTERRRRAVEILRGYRTFTTRPIRVPLSVSHAFCTALEKGRATEHKHPIYYTPKPAVCQLPIFFCRTVCGIRGGREPQGLFVITEATRDPLLLPPKKAPPRTMRPSARLICEGIGKRTYSPTLLDTPPCWFPVCGWPPRACRARHARPDPPRGAPRSRPPQTYGCHGCGRRSFFFLRL